MMKVKVAYALQHFQELLTRVALGEEIVIYRYNTPVAALTAPPLVDKPKREFGTLKGKAAILDLECFQAMNASEAARFFEER